MLSRLFSLIALVAVSLTLAAPVRAGADGPGVRAVRTANDTIAGLLKQKVKAGSDAEKALAAKVTTSVRDFLDIESLGQRALEDHWPKLSETQRTEFMALLRKLIEDNYVRGLRANLAYEVQYVKETKKGEQLTVETKIKTTRRGRPHVIAVNYVLSSSNGGWRAFDVVTDGVGLVENYRAQFNRIIAKDGFDGLLARMKKKSAR